MEIDIARQIGQAVRKQRTALGLTQSELAEKAHVDRSLIIRIESGEGKSLYPEKLLNILHALDLKMTIEPKSQHQATKKSASLKKDKNTNQHESSVRSNEKKKMQIQDRTIYEIRGVDEKLLLSTRTKTISK